MRAKIGWVLGRGIVPFFFLTLYWQTRFPVLRTYAVSDYAIPFIYLSDVLFSLILLGNLFLANGLRPNWRNRWFWVGAIGLVIFFTRGFWLSDQLAYTYRLIKLIEVGLLAWWIGRGRLSPRTIMFLIIAGLIPLICLGLIEVWLGQTVGLQLMGEWAFSKAMPGIATFSVWGFELMRPYATFPHPNVFGGVCGMWLFCALASWQATKRRSWLVAVLVLTVGVIASGSRAVWLGVIVGLIVMRGITSKFRISWRIVLGGLFVLAGFLVVGGERLWSLVDLGELSIVRRVELNLVAGRMFLAHPLWGVGLNQFVSEIDNYWQAFNVGRFYQPVHNIFLLILAETGLTGVLLGGLLILRCKLGAFFGRLPGYLIASWVFVLVTGLFDHYWLTLQAGQLTLGLLFGLSLARIKKDA